MIYLSGIQPSGTLHLGNYIGAIQQWQSIVNSLKKDDEAIFMIADLHSLTTQRNSERLNHNIIDLAAVYCACCLMDNENTTLFLQSEVKEHTELAWIFATMTPIGVLKRMTQFKDKSGKMSENSDVVNGGLLFYPCLMAADILLYDANFVPVGEDQTQHIEFTRDTAMRFNDRFKSDVFTLPKGLVKTEGQRIMSLTDGAKKMSKSSAISENELIYLIDSNDDIAKKIQRAKTDSEKVLYFDKQKRPEISNLMNIMSCLSGKSIEVIEQEYQNTGTKAFKDALTEVIINCIAPIRTEINLVKQDTDYLQGIMKQGATKARVKAESKMKIVKELIGLRYE